MIREVLTMAYHSQETALEKRKECAFNYVFRTVGNKTQSYKLWYTEHEQEPPKNAHVRAYKMFKEPQTQEFVEEYRRELRADYKNMKEKIVGELSEIAFDHEGTKGERTAALKELNSMFGYNNQNVNLNANADINVNLEGF